MLCAGLLSAAIYGGRIDSATDSRVLQAYVDRVFDSRVLSGSRPLPGAPAPLPPQTGNTASAATVVGGAKHIADMLPDIDTPATFGLAANVDRAELEAASSSAVVALKGLGAQHVTGAGAVDRSAWRSQLAPLIKMWEGLLHGSRIVQEARRMGRKESIRRQVRAAFGSTCICHARCPTSRLVSSVCQ